MNAIVESYLQGVSTRRVQEIVARLSINQLSPASVSQMVKDLDDQVQAFLVRQIEQAIPYFFVDALLQNPGRSTVRHQGDPGGRQSSRRWLRGDPGSENH